MKNLPDMDTALNTRIDALCEEGRELYHSFDIDVRQDNWHPFVAADYDCVREALVGLRAPGSRFLEWGSAMGVITVMADLMGFKASGIEIDASLVNVANDLAARFDSDARFAVGSFLPMGYEWKPPRGDRRIGTIGLGPSGYLTLRQSLDDFDVVYGFPWTGEESLMIDLMRTHGRPGARLLIHTPEHGARVFRDGRIEP